MGRGRTAVAGPPLDPGTVVFDSGMSGPQVRAALGIGGSTGESRNCANCLFLLESAPAYRAPLAGRCQHRGWTKGGVTATFRTPRRSGGGAGRGSPCR
ncbi:hypothetical protein EB231_15025 [Mesorhizobium sp. NZP2298]|nr:hypothetical protein EB231_15025 [Mesorhizobium sp. NZP2298]